MTILKYVLAIKSVFGGGGGPAASGLCSAKDKIKLKNLAKQAS